MNDKSNDASLRSTFVRSGALLMGHFQLSSGRHSGQYFQCALLLSDPALAERMGRSLAKLVSAKPAWPKPDIVLSPALGGVIIGHEVARALKTRALFVEREGGRMALRRGFRLKPGDKVLIVEDVITTGGSSREVAELVRSHGAKPLGVACIVLRTEGEPALNLPLKCLARLPAPSFPAEVCPLCAEGRRLVKPGSRPAPGAKMP